MTCVQGFSFSGRAPKLVLNFMTERAMCEACRSYAHLPVVVFYLPEPKVLG
jgi:hypothetical protein